MKRRAEMDNLCPIIILLTALIGGMAWIKRPKVVRTDTAHDKPGDWSN